MSKLADLLAGAVQTYKWLTQEVIPRTHPSDLPDATIVKKVIRPLDGWKGVEDVANPADVSQADEG